MKSESKPLGTDCRPQLFLFLSVDLAGSTAYKNSKRDGGDFHQWVLVFSAFYRDFEGLLYRSLVDCKESHGVVDGYDKPVIWKRLGDELLFTVELKHHTHPSFYISAFISALNAYDASLKEAGLPLSVKGTGWIAGFPIKNSIIPIEIRDEAGEVATPARFEYDYIGPSIDLGFRLTKFADSQKLVVSVGLAWLLASTTKVLFPIYSDGRRDLKGVPPAKGYPIFWIKRNNVDDLELKVLRIEACPKDDLLQFFEAFFADKSNETGKPFIDGDDRFNDKPEGYDELLAKAAKLYIMPYRPIEDDSGTEAPNVSESELQNRAENMVREAGFAPFNPSNSLPMRDEPRQRRSIRRPRGSFLAKRRS